MIILISCETIPILEAVTQYKVNDIEWRINKDGFLKARIHDHPEWGYVCGIWMTRNIANKVCTQIEGYDMALSFETVMLPTYVKTKIFYRVTCILYSIS